MYDVYNIVSQFVFFCRYFDDDDLYIFFIVHIIFNILRLLPDFCYYFSRIWRWWIALFLFSPIFYFLCTPIPKIIYILFGYTRPILMFLILTHQSYYFVLKVRNDPEVIMSFPKSRQNNTLAHTNTTKMITFCNVSRRVLVWLPHNANYHHMIVYQLPSWWPLGRMLVGRSKIISLFLTGTIMTVADARFLQVKKLKEKKNRIQTSGIAFKKHRCFFYIYIFLCLEPFFKGFLVCC